MYIPCLTFDENQYAKCSSNDNFSNGYLQSSSVINEKTFDKAVYLLGISVNGISARETESAYHSFISWKVANGIENDSHQKCESSCALSILALWRILGFPHEVLCSGTPYNGGAQQVIDKITLKQENGYKSYKKIPSRESGEEIFSIGNAVGVKLNPQNNTHYFMVASKPILMG